MTGAVLAAVVMLAAGGSPEVAAECDAQTLKIVFEVAAPNAPDKFNKYLEGAAKRKQP